MAGEECGGFGWKGRLMPAMSSTESPSLHVDWTLGLVPLSSRDLRTCPSVPLAFGPARPSLLSTCRRGPEPERTQPDHCEKHGDHSDSGVRVSELGVGDVYFW